MLVVAEHIRLESTVFVLLINPFLTVVAPRVVEIGALSVGSLFIEEIVFWDLFAAEAIRVN